MPYYDLHDKIDACFQTISSSLRSLGSQGKYHQHVQSEIFFRDLLNQFLGYDLKSLPVNAKAIDLYEDGQGICIQVSTQNDSVKIRDTVQKLNEIVTAQPKKNVKELFILFLTTDPVSAMPKPAVITQDYDFDEHHLWNLNSIRALLVARCQDTKSPTLDEEILDYLYYGIDLYRELAKRQYSELPIAVQTSYIPMPASPLPVFAGTYWGLDRGTFTGLYVNFREESGLLAELQDMEQQLAAAGSATQNPVPSRIWQEVHTREKRNRAAKAALRDAMRGNDPQAPALNGLIIHIRPDPSRRPEAYRELVRQWCEFIRQLRVEESGFPPAALFDLQLQGLDHWQQEDILQIHQLISKESRDTRAAVLISGTDDNPPPTGGFFAQWQFPARPGTVRSPAELEPLFLLICALGDRAAGSSDPKTFFEQVPLLYALCQDHDAQFYETRRAYQLDLPVADPQAVVEALHRYCTAETDPDTLFEELLALQHRYFSRKVTGRFIAACARSVFRAAQYQAFKFSTARSGQAYLDHWVAAALIHDQPPVYQVLQAEKVLVSLFKAINEADGRPSDQEERLFRLCRHYLVQLPPGHIFPVFFDLMHDQDAGPEIFTGRLPRLSHGQALQAVQCGLTRRFRIPIADILKRITPLSEPAIAWKTLFFSQRLGQLDLEDLLGERDPLIRAVAGLCTGEELGAAPYQHLAQQVNACRTLKTS